MEDSVGQDTKLLGQRNGNSLILNRNEWKNILQNAKARPGFSNEW
jgi:hypothetical protein